MRIQASYTPENSFFFGPEEKKRSPGRPGDPHICEKPASNHNSIVESDWCACRGCKSLQIADSLVDIGVYGMIRRCQVSRCECGLYRFAIVVAQGVSEDRPEVFDSQSTRPHFSRVVETMVHLPGVDEPPAIAEIIRGHTGDVEALAHVPLQDADCIDLPIAQHVHSIAAQLRRVEPIEEDWSAAALSMTDFTSEDRRSGRFISASDPEVVVA